MFVGYAEKVKLGREVKQWSVGLAARSPRPDVEALTTLRAWLSRLTDREAGGVALEMVELCRLPGFDLAWFHEILRRPQPGSPAERMMAYFGLAIYQRWNTTHHQRITGWLDAPRRTGNREFGWQIYLRLVEAGFTRFPGEFLLDPPARRRAIIENTIRSAYTLNYDLLAALTREVIFLEGLQQH
jgi:hypothetical protein